MFGFVVCALAVDPKVHNQNSEKAREVEKHLHSMNVLLVDWQNDYRDESLNCIEHVHHEIEPNRQSRGQVEFE
jgi:hypothetical protein